MKLHLARFVGPRFVALDNKLSVIAAELQDSQTNNFRTLSEELKDTATSVLGEIQNVKNTQRRLLEGQDRWGNTIMDGIRDLPSRINSHVRTAIIIVEAIISIICGIVVGIYIKTGAAKVVEQIYDKNLTPIGSVPKFSEFEVWAFTLASGIGVAIVLFMIVYGITLLINRHRQATP